MPFDESRPKKVIAIFHQHDKTDWLLAVVECDKLLPAALLDEYAEITKVDRSKLRWDSVSLLKHTM